MPDIPSNIDELLELIAQEIIDNNSGLIEEHTLRYVLNQLVKILDTKVSLISPTLTAEQLEIWKKLADFKASDSLGVITTATVFPEAKCWGFAAPGTYPNANNLVIDANNIAVITFDGTDTYSRVQLPIPQATQFIPSFTGSTFPIAGPAQRIYNDTLWEIASGTSAAITEVPGVSSKWVKKVGGQDLGTDTEFKNKIGTKSMSSKQLFDFVIGDFIFSSTIVPLTMTLPNDFNINNAVLSDLPAIAKYTYKTSLYSDFEFFTSVDVYFAKTGTWNIYIYAKNNLNTPSQTIPVVVSSIGIKNVVFSSPIDATQYMIFISEGVGYYVHSSSVTQNIVSGVLTDQTVVYIGMVLHGTKTVNENSKKIVEQINDLKNSVNFRFDNVLYSKKNEYITSVIGEGGGSTFTIDSSGLNLYSSGIGNGVVIDRQYNLGIRFLELKVKFSSDTKFYVGTQFSENNIGKAFSVIDSVAKTITIYNLDSTTAVASSTTFAFNIVNNREYIIRLYKLNDLTKVELIDTITGDKASTQVSQLGQFDKYKFGFVSSTANPVISSIAVKSIIYDRPFIAFYGDSITEGNTVGNSSNTPYYKDRFANLIGLKLNKPYYVSGRSAGTIDGVLARVVNELPYLKPKYVFVTIGTNNGNTEAKLSQLVDYCESMGSKVILNLIPLYDSSTAAKNTMIQSIVDARKLLSVKMNVATSVNADGVTKDNSLFANESGVYIHPNVVGNQKIYERSLIDIPEVYQEVGVY